MADILKFVDSIAASPTVRLDINDEVKWWVKSFAAPPPRLRRAMSSNAMRDGVNVSSSQYDARTLTVEIDLRTSTQDDNATELQKLARELDRADNFLMYQPTGATKPVFFRLFRSDMSQIENITGSKAFRRPTIELLAEPFAYGLRETLGPFTVNNDPAAGSNGLYFDVTGVIGDVAAPMVMIDATSAPYAGVFGVRQHGTPSDLTFFAQAESSTLGADTTNPGGGPDAAMSGTGTNNYVRTSFAGTPGMATRISGTLPGSTTSLAAGLAMRGRYRVLAAVRVNGTASIRIQSGTTVVTVSSAVRQVVDLGLISISPPSKTVGSYSPDQTVKNGGYSLSAARDSGTGTLDWDFVALIPADEAMFRWSQGGASTSLDLIVDGVNGATYVIDSGGDPFAGTAGYDAFNAPPVVPISGGFPSLVPNQTNRFCCVITRSGSGVSDKTLAEAFTVHYWPHYMYVRPSAT